MTNGIFDDFGHFLIRIVASDIERARDNYLINIFIDDDVVLYTVLIDTNMSPGGDAPGWKPLERERRCQFLDRMDGNCRGGSEDVKPHLLVMRGLSSNNH
jgi:hypothetical protein